MPVNHAKGNFEFCSCCGLIFMAVFGNFDQLVLTHKTFFQKKKLAQIITNG